MNKDMVYTFLLGSLIGLAVVWMMLGPVVQI